jgi:predicted nuclease with TOPRIM domain
VPDNNDDGEIEEPDQVVDLTTGQGLRKTELLQELEELKGIKEQHLERKRELEHVISGLQEELEHADAAFKHTRKEISDMVRKVNKIEETEDMSTTSR